MSVEKFIVTKQDSGYTSLPNSVLQKITNLEALGLWCYFQSKPKTWQFIDENIKKIFKIGRDKLEKLIAILKSHNLVETEQPRKRNGVYAARHLHVKNGCDFIPNPENTGTVKTSRKHRALKNRALDNRAPVNSNYKSKIDKIKKIEKQNKSFSAGRRMKNEKKHEWAPMKNEKASVAKNVELKLTKGMPESLRQICKGLVKKP